MKYCRLGGKGPIVSTIGFGAWAIGGRDWGPTDDAESLAALQAALDHGVTFIDTADVYGRGHSERLIARVIGRRGADDVVVATKAGNDFYNAAAEDDKGYGAIRQSYDRDYLIFAAEQSIRRLGVEALDILQLHSGDLAQLERDDPWDALALLKRQGKIKHAGWSVQSFQEEGQTHILDRHADLIDVIQVRYNLLERGAAKDLLPCAMRHDIGVIVRIPLLFGLLSGKFDRNARFGPDDHRRMNLSPDKLERYLADLARLHGLFSRFADQSMAQVSLRFCLTHPACHTVIPGAKTAEQVMDNCAASDLGPLPRDALAAVQD